MWFPWPVTTLTVTPEVKATSRPVTSPATADSRSSDPSVCSWKRGISLGHRPRAGSGLIAFAFVYESLTPQVVVAVAVAFVITDVLTVPGPKEPALLAT
jgi:hypothetical protein